LLWFADSAGKIQVHGFHRFSIFDPSICTKDQAIAAVLDRLVEVGALREEHQPEVLAAMLKREKLGSTGIGRGVAIPHARFPGVGSVVGVIASFPAGVEFDSLDSEPVKYVCLFVSPTGRRGEHLRVLEAAARRLREGN
jgi:mannitol/fructose-specific phosphotransferase system IIA component (Ntr-type)